MALAHRHKDRGGRLQDGFGTGESHAVLIYGLVATAFLWPALSISDGVPSPSAGLYAHVPWQGLDESQTAASDAGNPALADVTYQIQPWLLLLKSQLRSGELPLWNPYSFLGQPFWANGQSAPLFPLHLLFAALPTMWGFLLLPWLRLLIGALGTRRLALALGISPTGALLAGVVFPLSGMVTGYLLFPMANALVLVPWVLWATERLVAGAGSWRPLAICVALLALGGHPGTLSHCLLLSAVYLLVRGIPWRDLAQWLVGWTAGGALAMVHLLPVALYLPDTARWGHADAPAPGPGPPWTQVLAMSLRLLQPWAFGRAEDGSWHGLAYEPGSRVFLGLLTLILALVAVQSHWVKKGERDRRLLAIAAVLVFSAGVAYRTPFLLDAVESLPIVGRALHHRLLFGVDLCLAILAGAGLDRLAAVQSGAQIRRAAALMAVGFGLLVAVVSRSSGQAFGDVLMAQLPWLIWLTVAVALLHWLRLARQQTTAATLLLLPVLLVAAELTVAHSHSAPGLSASDLYPSTPAIEFLRGQPGNVAAVGQALRPGASIVYGLRDLRGDDPARPRRFDQQYQQVGSTRTPFFHPVEDWSHPWLDAAGIRWVMAPPHAEPPDPLWLLAFEGSDARVFERPDARPEAWLVGADSATGLHVVRPANSRVRIEGLGGAEFPDRRVVLSQAWAPGWTVRLGERTLDAVPHEEFLLAADIPANIGPREAVEFVYRPPGLVAGAWLSLLTLIVLVWPPASRIALKRKSGTTRIHDEADRGTEPSAVVLEFPADRFQPMRVVSPTLRSLALLMPLWLTGVIALLITSAASAQMPHDPTEDDLRNLGNLLRQLEEGDLADLDTDQFDEELWAAATLEALDADKNVRARELAEQILDQDPESVAGHILLGLVYHHVEGNLPRAFFHLQYGRQRIEDAGGPVDDGGWNWHALSISAMAMVSGEMGRHRDKVQYLLERDALYEPAYPADRGWPLMRLRQYEAAKDAVLEALALEGRPDQKAHALTALCAIEAEQLDRRRGYEACMAAAEWEREHGDPAPTPFTNAAEGSLGMLLHDQAERLMLEASDYFRYGTVSNPWLDLMELYVAEGRLAEALDASRLMLDWRHNQPVFMEEQNRAETEMASASFLLVAGYASKAAEITRRALERPDRTGFTSSDTEQLQAAAALLDALVHRTAAEEAAERATWLPFTDAARAYAESLQLRLRAWSSARRAASLIESERMLLATLRPYLAGSVEIAEWLEPELVEALGPGVVGAALRRAEEVEDLETASGYLRTLEAEVAWAEGDEDRTLRLVEQAMDELPAAEQLMRGRLAALGAMAARNAGDAERSNGFFDLALQIDPGVLRRLGAELPVRLAVNGGDRNGVPQRAAKMLRKSPRFDVGRGAFEIQVDGNEGSGTACLVGPRGTRFACAQVTVRAGDEGADDVARRLVEVFHREAFAPKLDLTQADLQSLDGSPTAAGGRAKEQLRSVTDRLVSGG